MKKFGIILLCIPMLMPIHTQAKIKMKKSVKIGIGEKVKLKVKGTKKKIKWSSNKKSVAIVNQKGVVKGKKKGTAVITAKVGKQKVKCKVTVKGIKVKSIALTNIPTYDLTVGDTFTLKATIKPANASNKKLKWTSSNTNIATVNNGKVSCKKPGTFRITVQTTDGSNIKMNQNFKVIEEETYTETNHSSENPEIPVSSMKISGIPSSVTVGQSFTLVPTLSPSNATNKTVTWKSSDSSVATVSNGKVHCLKAGTFIITAVTSNGLTWKKTFTVSGNVLISQLNLNGIPAGDCNVGETFTLQAVISPSNASNKKLKWTSNNTSVATVSNGTVKCLKEGTATITVSTTDGSNLSIPTSIKVVKKTTVEPEITIEPDNIPVSSMKISGIPSGTLEVGQSFTLVPTLSPSNASNKTVTWKSSNTSVATISNGKVNCLKAGTFTITATASNGLTWNRTFTVGSDVKITQMNLNGIPVGSCNVGEKFKLEAVLTPSNATNKTLSWKSSNTSVATVDSNGNVSCLKEGTTTITVSTTDGSNLSIPTTINVVKKTTVEPEITINPSNVPVSSMTVSGIPSGTLKSGQSFTLVPTISPSNATNKTVTWTSSNTSVATVSNGKVNCLKDGTFIITATTSNGVKWQRTFTVNSTVKAQKLSLSNIPTSVKVGDEFTLIAKVSPEDTTNKTLSWTTSAPSIATVNNGKVKCLKAGTFTITVSTTDGSNLSMKETFTAEPSNTQETQTELPTTLRISGIPSGTLEVRQSFTLVPTILPDNAIKTITWTSSNTGTATVNNGKVNCLKAGTFTITAKTINGLSWKKDFTITNNILVKELSLSNIPNGSSNVGDKFTLKPTISPSNATNKTLNWKSSDTSVATVDSNGNVSCLKEGTAIITVSTADESNVSLNVSVKVVKKTTYEPVISIEG